MLIDGMGMHSYQVHEFVKLSELYYAGSHGMDIMGPIRISQSVSDHPDCIKTTDSKVQKNIQLNTFSGL